MILGIDCSASPSGGGRRHLQELFSNFDVKKHRFEKIKLWASQVYLDSLPEYPWLIKMTHPFLDGNVIYKFIWRIFIRDKSINNQVDVLFSPFGTYTGKVKPYVSMSRNMLIFDKIERNRFFISITWLKLITLYFIQKKSFKNADGIIFISVYARNYISKIIDLNNKLSVIINHGISKTFDIKPREQFPIEKYSKKKPYRILFLSSIWVYKHPLKLLKAIEILYKKGYPIHLNIVGDNAQKEIGDALEAKIHILSRENGNFITWHKDVKLGEVQKHYINNDMFIFTSTCENMPNILIEAMASGLPICCSSFPPMPEFLEDAGVYIDPLNVNQIALTIEKLLLNPQLRTSISEKSYSLSNKFSWDKCTDETFNFLYTIANK